MTLARTAIGASSIWVPYRASSPGSALNGSIVTNCDGRIGLGQDCREDLPLVVIAIFAIFALLPADPGLLALLDKRLHRSPKVVTHGAGADEVLPRNAVRRPRCPDTTRQFFSGGEPQGSEVR